MTGTAIGTGICSRMGVWMDTSTDTGICISTTRGIETESGTITGSGTETTFLTRPERFTLEPFKFGFGVDGGTGFGGMNPSVSVVKTPGFGVDGGTGLSCVTDVVAISTIDSTVIHGSTGTSMDVEALEPETKQGGGIVALAVIINDDGVTGVTKIDGVELT